MSERVLKFIKEALGVLMVLFTGVVLITPAISIIYTLRFFQLIHPMFMIGLLLVPAICYPVVKGMFKLFNEYK